MKESRSLGFSPRRRLGRTRPLYERVRRKGDETAAEFAEVIRKLIKGLVVYADGRIKVKADPAAGLLLRAEGSVI